MKYLFFGLSITSSWGNGHATTYRGLLRALAAEIREKWVEATRYLNMELLAEHKREQLWRRAAA